MKKEDCFQLGIITKSIGYKGEVVLFVDADEPMKYKGLDLLLVDSPTGLIPYEVLNINPNRAPKFRLKLYGVETEEAARALSGKEVYLPLDVLPKLEGNKFYFHEVIGFSVKDQLGHDLGVISRIIDFDVNPLIEIKKGFKEILVPLKEPFLKDLDRSNKILNVELPDGYLEIYFDDKVSDEEE